MLYCLVLCVCVEEEEGEGEELSGEGEVCKQVIGQHEVDRVGLSSPVACRLPGLALALGRLGMWMWMWCACVCAEHLPWPHSPAGPALAESQQQAEPRNTQSAKQRRPCPFYSTRYTRWSYCVLCAVCAVYDVAAAHICQCE